MKGETVVVVALTSGILVGTEFQLVYHTINTSPTCWIKTKHITTSVIIPHTPNILTTKILITIHFNPYLNYLHNFKQIYNFNCYGVMVTGVLLYYCGRNITGIATETCWRKHCE